MKRLAILTAAAALALVPAAAAAPNPGKHDRAAKTERTKKAKPGSARARCAAERREIGVKAFAEKYGKTRTKGSARAKAKAARAAFGRCVAKAARAIRAEREAVEEEADLEDALDEVEAGDEGELGGDVLVDGDPAAADSPEPDEGDDYIEQDAPGGAKGRDRDDEADDPVVDGVDDEF